MHSCSVLDVCRLPQVLHGTVPNTMKDLYKPQDALTVTCNAGFAPSTVVTICQSNKIWTPQPICTYVACTIPRLDNGYYAINGIQNGTTQPYGTTIYPNCSQLGYTPSTSTARTCQESGTWSGSDPTCIPIIICNSVPEIENGYYVGGSNSRPYFLNQEIKLICKDGFNIFGASNIRKCSNTDTWSANNHTCERITCNDTSDVRHDSIVGYPYPDIGFAEVGTVTLNSSFFYLKEGSLEVSCLADTKLSWINSPVLGILQLFFS